MYIILFLVKLFVLKMFRYLEKIWKSYNWLQYLSNLKKSQKYFYWRDILDFSRAALQSHSDQVIFVEGQNYFG